MSTPQEMEGEGGVFGGSYRRKGGFSPPLKEGEWGGRLLVEGTGKEEKKRRILALKDRKAMAGGSALSGKDFGGGGGASTNSIWLQSEGKK